MAGPFLTILGFFCRTNRSKSGFMFRTAVALFSFSQLGVLFFSVASENFFDKIIHILLIVLIVGVVVGFLIRFTAPLLFLLLALKHLQSEPLNHLIISSFFLFLSILIFFLRKGAGDHSLDGFIFKKIKRTKSDHYSRSL